MYDGCREWAEAAGKRASAQQIAHRASHDRRARACGRDALDAESQIHRVGVVIDAPSGNPAAVMRSKLLAFGPLPGAGPVIVQPPSPSSKDVVSGRHASSG